MMINNNEREYLNNDTKSDSVYARHSTLYQRSTTVPPQLQSSIAPVSINRYPVSNHENRQLRVKNHGTRQEKPSDDPSIPTGSARSNPLMFLFGALLYLFVLHRWVIVAALSGLTRPQSQPHMHLRQEGDTTKAGLKPPQQRKQLEFIHITKTAGSSIEEAAARSGIRWGACHWKKIGTFGTNCTGAWRGKRILYNRTRVPYGFSRNLIGEPWHTPHYWFLRNPYEESPTFVVARNPYERCVSEYYSKFGGYKGRNRNDPKVMNSFLLSRIKKFRGLHFLPQHLYVYDEDGRRVVEHVLQFENLDEEFSSLMHQYDLPVELPRRFNVRNATRSQLTVANLTTEAIAAINHRYVDDFRRFKYRVVTRAEALLDPSSLAAYLS